MPRVHKDIEKKLHKVIHVKYLEYTLEHSKYSTFLSEEMKVGGQGLKMRDETTQLAILF